MKTMRMLLFAVCFAAVFASGALSAELVKSPVKQFGGEQPGSAGAASESYHYTPVNYRPSFLAETVKFILSKEGTIMANDDLNVVIAMDSPENIKNVKKLLEDVDKLPRQIVIRVKALKINTGAMKNNGVNLAGIFEKASYKDSIGRNTNYSKDDGDRISTSASGSIDYGDLDTTANNSSLIDETLSLDVIRARSLSLNYYQLSELISFMVGNNYASVTSEPKIVTMNNKTGKVFIGDRVKIVKNEFVVSTGNVDIPGASNNLTEEAGLSLEVTPHIGESDFITMDIKTGFGSISGYTATSVKSTVSEAESSVIVKSGEPIIIGGYKTKELTESTYKFPVIGSIPVIKKLFSKKTKLLSDVELMIILTPEIVSPGAGLKDETAPEAAKAK